MAMAAKMNGTSLEMATINETTDAFCSPCADDKQEVEATCFCVECGDYLCAKCLHDHGRFSRMRAHEILNKEEMFKSQHMLQTKSLPTEKCGLHHGRLIDTYCKLHDVVCCAVCISINHRSCRDVSYLPTAAKGVKSSKEVNDVKDATKAVMDQLNKVKKQREEDIVRIQKEKDDAIENTANFTKRLIEYLQCLEKETTEQVLEKYQQCEDKIKADIASLEKMISRMEEITKPLRARKVDEVKLFVCVKRGKQCKNDSTKLLDKIQTNVGKETVQLVIDSSIDEYLQDLKALGELMADIRDNEPFSAERDGHYNVRSQDDKGLCCITDAYILHDGTTLLADCHNKNLKRLDTNFQVMDTCELSGQPWGVCETRPAEAAVTLSKKITLVSVAQKLSPFRSFPVSEDAGRCYGIAFNGGELFVSRSGHPKSVVQVYNTTGTLLRSVQSDSTGMDMFDSPKLLAINKWTSKVYVTDKALGVYIIKKNGVFLSEIKDSEIESPMGVCVCTNGQLLVCGYNSHDVVQFGRDGKRLGVILRESDGIYHPYSVTFNQATSKLIVTMGRNDYIKVFNLSLTQDTTAANSSLVKWKI